MLFDRRPKLRREEFYDREAELQLLAKGVEAGEGLVVVYGVRRVGKTSLVYVGLNELGMPFVPIDLRKYSESPALLSPSAIAQVIDDVLKEYEGFKGKAVKFVESFLKRVDSIDLKLVKLRTRRKGRKLLFETLERVDAWARRHGTRVAIVLDEAQELRTVPTWRNILAWSVDTLENVTYIVTGSEVGVLKEFLRLDDPKSPLFGRSKLEISLGKFTKEQSQDFLRRGFSELGMKVKDEEIEDAVNKLDGIVGWLTLYGYYRSVYRIPHSEALSKVEGEAQELLSDELEKLIKYSPRRYLAILKAVSLGLKSWSTIKHFVEGATGYIPDSKFNKLLHNLVKYGFIEKSNSEYRIIEPLLPKALERLQKKYRL